MSTIHLNIPKSWNELNTKTLKKIAWLYFTKKPSLELDFQLFFTLLNIRWWQIVKYLKVRKVLKYVPISELRTHFDFLYTKADLTTFVPHLKINGIIYEAPANRLHNITAEQFAFCENLDFYFTQKKEIEYLRYLAASLYFYPGETFSKNTIDKKVAQFKKVDDKTLLAIAFGYKGSSAYIRAKYPVVFKKSVSTSTDKKKPTPPDLDKTILFLVNNSTTFNGFAEAKTTNVHDYLAALTTAIKKTSNGQ